MSFIKQILLMVVILLGFATFQQLTNVSYEQAYANGQKLGSLMSFYLCWYLIPSQIFKLLMKFFRKKQDESIPVFVAKKGPEIAFISSPKRGIDWRTSTLFQK